LVPMLEPLLARYSGEAREVLLFDIYRMFCRLAGGDIQACRNWLRMVFAGKETWSAEVVSRFLILFALSIAKLSPGHQRFKFLQRMRAIIFAKLGRKRGNKWDGESE